MTPFDCEYFAAGEAAMHLVRSCDRTMFAPEAHRLSHVEDALRHLREAAAALGYDVVPMGTATEIGRVRKAVAELGDRIVMADAAE